MSALSGGRCATPLVNAESAENKLRHAVYRNWKNIQKYCRECDSDGTGQIQPSEFKCKCKAYFNSINYPKSAEHILFRISSKPTEAMEETERYTFFDIIVFPSDNFLYL